MYYQVIKKQVGRQEREREGKRECESDNHLPKHDTCFHIKEKWYMCCVLNTEVLSSEGFLQSHKNM